MTVGRRCDVMASALDPGSAIPGWDYGIPLLNKKLGPDLVYLNPVVKRILRI